jgi:hypothetical protein
MAKKLNSMRWLEAQGVRYEVLSFPDTIHSAVGVAAYYGLPYLPRSTKLLWSSFHRTSQPWC